MHFNFPHDTGVDAASAIRGIGSANAGLGVMKLRFLKREEIYASEYRNMDHPISLRS
jgi:hypothetical protein